MAYQSNGARPQSNSTYRNQGTPRPAAAATAATGGVKKEFVDDPNEVAIGYEKEMKTGGTYITFTVKKDVAAGTKVTVFANDKVKNRTEKTPTHKMKLSKTQPQG